MSSHSRSAASVIYKILGTSLLASLLFVAGCGSSYTATIGPPAKLAFTAQPGNVAAGSSITPAVVVSVEDAQGNVVTTATNQITMAIGTNPSTGTLGGTTAVTAVNGVATFSSLSINNPGTGYTLAASATGLTGATSSSFNVIGAATKLAFTVQPGNVAAGASITPAVAVSVEDALGNVVTTGAAATSQITIAIGTNPSSGTLGGTAQANAVAGVATFSNLNLNKVGVGYTLTATATGLTSATSNTFNVTVGAATKLAFTVQPVNVAAGASITPAVAVSVEDAQGNVVTTATNQITIAIGTNPSSGTLSGTAQTNAVAGVATFSNLSINKVGSGYTLVASATGLTSMISSAVNVTAGAATKLAFTVQPGSVAAGGTITVAVSIQDAAGNLVTTANNSVSMVIGTNPSSGTLGGTTPVTAVAGVATFSDLSINNAGIGYTLTASAAGLTGTTSNAFNVIGAATQLMFTVQPSNVVAGGSITPAVRVSVEDALGNVVTTATNQITIAIGTNPSSGTLSGTALVTAVAGVATFPTLSINNVGNAYTLTASASGFSTVPSNTFNVTAVITDPCATIVAGSESLLTGQYVWTASGFDNGTTPEAAFVGGVLAFNGTNNGGLITSGTLDQNLNAGLTSQSVTGTYKVNSTGRGCMAITTTSGTTITQHYRFSVNTAGTIAHLINFDAAGPFTSGTMRKQTTIPASLSGAFAFGASGANCNNSVCGGKFGVVGITTFATNGTATGALDINTNGQIDNTLTNWPSTPGVTFTGGSYTINATTGRGTLTFTPSGSTNAVNIIIYVVSPTDLLLLDKDTQTNNSIFVGEALAQTGTFSNASLSGSSIFYNTSFNQNSPPSNPSTSNTLLAQITVPSSGNLSFFGYEVQGSSGTPGQGSVSCAGSGNAPACVADSGTYVIDSTGRMTLPTGGGNHPPVFYFVTANQAFFLGSSPSVETGMLLGQTSTAAPSGAFAFGTIDLATADADTNSGTATFGGTFSAIADDNSKGSLGADQILSPLSFGVDSTGLGTIPSGCTIAASGGTSTCKSIFYVISTSKVVLMSITGENSSTVKSNPTISIGDK